MKPTLQITNRRQSGVALIIVLAVLVLMSALIVGFFTSVTNERNSSQIAAAGTNARQIADTTLNLVLSQIREATSVIDPATGKPDDKSTWASQPGAIRTFSGQLGGRTGLSNGAHTYKYAAGGNDWVYRLYSSRSLKVSATAFAADLKVETDFIEKYNPFDADPEKDARYLDFVDLNEPLLVPVDSDANSANPSQLIVEPRYPIVDPRARGDRDGSITSTRYGSIQGFDCKKFVDDEGNIYYRSKDANGLYTGSPKKVPYLPMPVRWLYVLKDGTMVPSENGRVTGATKDNPIVARTAYWTDDDTNKLNINTASEGTYWGTPTASSRPLSGEVTRTGTLVSTNLGNPDESVNLSASPGSRFEYQRYPGHPATTSLSPVFGWLWDLWPTNPDASFSTANYVDFKEAMAAITPFMPTGVKPPIAIGSSTSKGGSQNPEPFTPTDTVLNKRLPVLTVPTKHLYASIDELLFPSDRFLKNGTLPVGAANPEALRQKFPKATITPEAIERARFFVTHTGRSPDLNGYGRPRVTFWPVGVDLNYRTAYDELFAFSSTINGQDPANAKRFFLTRWNPYSSTKDLTDLPSGTDYPNPRPDNNLKFTDVDGKTKTQNVAMLDYLRWLTGGGAGTPGSAPTNIPGFGGNFLTKYGKVGPNAPERDQILTFIVDYMRTVNLVDTGEGKQAGVYKPFTPPFYDPTKRPTNRGYTPTSRSNEGSSQVTPLVVVNADGITKGLGRFVMMTEAAMVFYTHTYRAAGNGTPADHKIQAALLFEMSTPMAGYPALRDTYFTKLREVRPNVVIGNGGPQPFWPSGTKLNVSNVSSHETSYGRGFMATMGCTAPLIYYSPVHARPTTVDPTMRGKAWTAPLVKQFINDHVSNNDGSYQRGETEKYYPYVSKVVSLGASPNYTWNGGSFVYEIWSGEAPDDPKAQLVQVVNFAFPATALNFSAKTVVAKLEDRMRSVGTGYDSNTHGNLLDANNHYVRGVEFTGGSGLPLSQKMDLRLGMSRPLLLETDFEPREGPNGRYFDSARLHCHSLQSGHGDPYTGYSSTGRGVIAKGGTNRGSKPVILPKDVNGVTMANNTPGDFDRGLSKHMDGSFGNKVDEGNLFFAYDDGSLSGVLPYYRGRAIEETGQSFFSPNRQIPSAVMFGSLPSGALGNRPWQTLLFRPDRTINPGGHPGGKPPLDHHLLDLFNLPIIEPYAISEPFSTDGRVNLNYAMMPFSYAKGDSGNLPHTSRTPRPYIHRDTALRGVLKAVKIMAVPTGTAEGGHAEQPLTVADRFHWDVDLNKTLEAFEERLKDKDRGLFRSASEVCEMDLYPRGLSSADWGTFWDNQYAQSGDNMREYPYAIIYPRVTTKSNSYTVHMRCQVIRKAPNTPHDQFVPGRDTIAGEYRGSTSIERFIDPSDPKLKDYNWSKTDGTGRLDPYYRFRVVGTKHLVAR